MCNMHQLESGLRISSGSTEKKVRACFASTKNARGETSQDSDTRADLLLRGMLYSALNLNHREEFITICNFTLK